MKTVLNREEAYKRIFWVTRIYYDSRMCSHKWDPAGLWFENKSKFKRCLKKLTTATTNRDDDKESLDSNAIHP